MGIAIAFVLFFVALAIGNIHAKLGDGEKPIWPAKLLIILGLGSPTLKEERKKELSRRDFSFLEQFMAATFIWFSILALALLIIVMIIL